MGKDLLIYPGIKDIFIRTILITIIEAGTIIVQAAALSKLLYQLFDGSPFSTNIYLAFIFLIAFIIRYLMNKLKKRIIHNYADEASRSMKEKLIAKLIELGPSFTNKLGTAKLVTLAVEGTNQIRTYLDLFVPKMIGAIVISLVIIVYVFFTDKISSVILLLTIPIIVVFMILLGLAANKKIEQQWESYHLLANHYVDSLRGMETLKFLGLSKSHGITIDKVNTDYRKSTMATLKIAFLSSFALDFFTMLSIASVAVGLGFRLIEGDILLDIALVVLILSPEFFLPTKEVGANYHATLNGKEAQKSIQAILTKENGTKNAIVTNNINWDSGSTLKLSSVNYSYEKNQSNVLTDISMAIKGFEKIGIIGASGAGKSTLIDILGGFVAPKDGTIRVNNQIVNSLTADEWGDQVNYIPQNPYIFNESIANNIRFYQPDASEKEIMDAAKQAGLTNMINALPSGYNEKVGNGQRAVSGGQEQRIALARAFLSTRPILLLDEPTAHLDIETEYELKNPIRRLMRNKLVLFATHRLHWMEEMDRIIVLKDGAIIEMGTQQELLNKKGEYFSLVRTQLEGIQ